MDREEYEEHMSRTALEDYWNKLQECGWTEGMTDEGIEELRERLKESFEECPEEAFLDLAILSFDTECVENGGAYYSTILLLSGATSGRFEVEDVEVESADDHFNIVIRCDGRTFEREIPVRGDWFQVEGIIDLLNEALSLVDSDYRFHQLPARGQDAHIVFVPRQAYELATALGLIPSS